MKNIVIIFMSAAAGVLTLAILMTVVGRMNRRVELESSLSSALEKTLERMMTENHLYPDTQEEAVAESVEMLAAALDTDSKVTVQVMKADMEKGALAVRVQEEFVQPDGSTGVEEWERMVIWEPCETKEPVYCSVRFYPTKEAMLSGGECYKVYSVMEGDRVAAPAEPLSGNGRFLGWKDSNDYMADFSLPVEQERVYYAQWG